ncbi:DUF6602 domain-containing protein [Algibacillus agarilyticus]|uniref:DUF6602 domain-containing protein n=1 Tax=Algibacillus agarilyticus TaxID=2234133 RepID=UPI000DCF8A38|nr:DUF6602 domain-containing protein [Algibacillus agarilyticus]
MNTKVFQKYCENSLKILNSKYEATKVLNHNATAGAAREQILKDFLSDHLPELITVLSGQIFDSEDNYSKQQDIVLVLKSMPRLQFASDNDLIFQEGVVATMEVKTTLNLNVLKSIGDNIASVRSLKSASSVGAQLGVTHNWPTQKILTSIVTYGGSRLELILDQLAQLEPEQKPDLLLDLSQGLLIRNHGLLVTEQGTTDYLLESDAAVGFKLFLTFMTEITGTLSARGVSWRKYI